MSRRTTRNPRNGIQYNQIIDEGPQPFPFQGSVSLERVSWTFVVSTGFWTSLPPVIVESDSHNNEMTFLTIPTNTKSTL
jgi:hypothetical protein